MTEDTTTHQPTQDEERAALREQLRRARRQLRRTERRMERRQDEIDELSAQVEILELETMSPVERYASTSSSATPAELEADRGVASFLMSLRMHRRHFMTGVNEHAEVREPIVDLDAKHIARQFAAAHGVLVPEVFGQWPTPDDIDWDSLPDRFVIKSTFGGGAVNVFPVERREGGLHDHIGGELLTPEVIAERLWRRHREDSVYFAEEFLVGSEGDTMPEDIKVFCFYGEPGYIEVRSDAWSRKRGGQPRVRTFLPDGTEIFNVRALIPRGDEITEPSDLDAIVTACRALSGAIRRPVQRLDFYETDHGLVFGEVTHNPGHSPALPRSWDRRFGETYEDASARLISDLVEEGNLGLTYGEEPEAAGPDSA